MECDADDKFSVKEFRRQFNIKMAVVVRFLFYAFSMYAAIRGDAVSVTNKCHLCVVVLFRLVTANNSFYFDYWNFIIIICNSRTIFVLGRILIMLVNYKLKKSDM
jgi:hypothetical protein